ncbi:hypothetical protein ACFLZM_06525 [Thermodesulfobacteriota bacterium]
MLDISISYNRYKFVGHEFLTWLWFLIENEQGFFKLDAENRVSLDIGNRIVLENRINEAVESITIKGDEAGLEEGLLALRKGAVVTEINLAFSTEENKWQFTLKGESLAFSSLKTPDAGGVETGEDVEGAVLEKVYLYEHVIRFTEDLFKRFIHKRISPDWNKTVVPQIKNWIHAG